MWSTLEDAGLAQNTLAAGAPWLTPRHHPSVHSGAGSVWRTFRQNLPVTLILHGVQGFEPTPLGAYRVPGKGRTPEGAQERERGLQKESWFWEPQVFSLTVAGV